jgi:hypothetical protein
MSKGRQVETLLYRGYVHFCSVKGFYCGRAKRTQIALCEDCPAELEEREGRARIRVRDESIS